MRCVTESDEHAVSKRVTKPGFFAAATCLLLLSACSTLDRRVAVPLAERREAVVLGLPNARFFVDEPAAMAAEQQRALLREAHSLGVEKAARCRQPIFWRCRAAATMEPLAPGCWSAGRRMAIAQVQTRGRREHGRLDRAFRLPRSEYDQPLTDVYTNINPGKVFEKRFTIYAAVAQDALSDTSPLYQTISHYIDESVIARIGAEYEKGRLLLIQTTDLDAGRPVLWNIGAIAASRDPRALDLIRHIMLASASIPAAFPPVMFDVEANGVPYQEMHVDGGAVSQAFLVPPSLNARAALDKTGYRRNVAAYIIRNSRLTTEWSDVERST